MRLADYLSREQITASAFAARIGRSVSTVTRIAAGSHRPDWPTMEAIRQATDGAVTPNDFIDPPEPTPEQRNEPAEDAA